jgi:hypothetical protein
VETPVWFAIVLLSGCAGGPPAAPADDERQISREVFNELKMKGEIMSSSPLYDLLNPITAA